MSGGPFLTSVADPEPWPLGAVSAVSTQVPDSFSTFGKRLCL